MPSLETLRRTIELSLRRNGDLLDGCTVVGDGVRELAAELTEAVARFIATEATLEAFADVPAPTEKTDPVKGARPKVSAELAEFVARQRARFETLPAFEMSMPEGPIDPTPVDGGIGARHGGRPGQTVADADERCPDCSGGGYLPSTACPRCKGTGQVTKAPRERLFFPRAFRTPGGDRWLAENGVRLWP